MASCGLKMTATVRYNSEAHLRLRNKLLKQGLDVKEYDIFIIDAPVKRNARILKPTAFITIRAYRPL